MQGRFDGNFICPHQYAPTITSMCENDGKKCDMCGRIFPSARFTLIPSY